MPSEAATLANLMNHARGYTLQYFELLKDQDLHRRFTAEGTELNTAFWIMAHLATTQNGLLLYGTGGEMLRFSWAKYYMPGAAGAPEDERPSPATVLDTFHAVHQKAVAHLRMMADDALSAPHGTKLGLGPQKRDLVMQAIRHESYHTGQLGWLCKLYGIKTR